MTDYRDPNYRDPARRDYRDPNVVPADSESWSGATWGWIAGFAVVALVLIFAFSSGRDADRSATDSANPPVTTGQGGGTSAPPSGMNPGAPTVSRPAPAPTAPAPVPAAPQP